MNETPHRPEGCENCPKPCALWHTEIADGEMRRTGMCADCPHAKSLLVPPPGAPIPDAPPPANRLRCPACGFTAAEFLHEQRLGCPQCYETFGPMLDEMISQAQGGAVSHVGKHPMRHDGMLARARIQVARAELAAAVAKEDYERAAVLRDEILELEKRLAPPPPPGIPPAKD